MTTSRMETFSDGVLAIIITIMVVQLPVPEGLDLHALRPLWSSLLSYLLSFLYLGMYWNNHHHLLQAAERINGRILWANLHLLFWLSLIPFVTTWMGTSGFAIWTVAAYGAVLLFGAFAFLILTRLLVSHHGNESCIAVVSRWRRKQALSLFLHAVAVPVAFANRWVSCAIFVAVAIQWLVPDRQIERTLEDHLGSS